MDAEIILQISIMVQCADYMGTPAGDSAQIRLGRGVLELLKEKADSSFTTEELENVALDKGVNSSPVNIVKIFTRYYGGLLVRNKRDQLWQLTEGVNLEDLEEAVSIMENRTVLSAERK